MRLPCQRARERPPVPVPPRRGHRPATALPGAGPTVLPELGGAAQAFPAAGTQHGTRGAGPDLLQAGWASRGMCWGADGLRRPRPRWPKASGAPRAILCPAPLSDHWPPRPPRSLRRHVKAGPASCEPRSLALCLMANVGRSSRRNSSTQPDDLRNPCRSAVEGASRDGEPCSTRQGPV